MKARVVDISNESIYLEIEEQIRFRSPYIKTPVTSDVHSEDVIEFYFALTDGHPHVSVDAVSAHLSISDFNSRI